MVNLNLRNPKIDLLRGIAILLVLFLHFNLSYHLYKSSLNLVFPEQFLQEFFSNGNYGVTLFFVISGFLITSMSIQRFRTLGNIRLQDFYVYRFARIMPCLVLALSIITLLSFTPLSIFKNTPHTTSFFMGIISVLTFWHNFLMQKVGYFNYCLNIYWSLSVEEVFYLIFPLLCVFFKRSKYLIFLGVVLIFAGPIARHLHSQDEIISLYGYFSCFDAIAMGCCTAIIANHLTFKNHILTTVTKYVATLSAIAIYCYALITHNVIWGPSLFALCTATLLLIAVQESSEIKSQNIIRTTIGWFGKNSYELYLFHIIVLALMKTIYVRTELGDATKLLWLLLFISTSAILSSLIATQFSQPFNSFLRKRWSNEQNYIKNSSEPSQIT
ncbi:MAG: acyltransferase [Gammaproteobacteria bacterium]|nr:acyltransferase [Gammaproteobacteria bacterium]